MNRQTKTTNTMGLVAWCLVLLIASSERINAADEVPETNLQRIVHAARNVAEDALDELAAEELADRLRAYGVTLSGRAPHEANWIAEAVIADALMELGIPVTAGTKRSSSNPSGIRLEYRILELGTEFTGQGRRGWIGRRYVDRLVRAKLSLQITDSETGQVLWRKERGLEVADRFPKRALPEVRSGTYPFTAAALKESDLSRIIEPVIVSAVVGWLTYLFFSNR